MSNQVEEIKVELLKKFTSLIERVKHPNFSDLSQIDGEFQDENVNSAWLIFYTLATNTEHSGVKRAYKSWVAANWPNSEKNPQVFFDYVTRVNSDEVTEIFKTWKTGNLDKERDLNCRMVILSGMAARALFDEQ